MQNYRKLLLMLNNEPGTLAYEYSLNEDESMLAIYDRYVDNIALLSHGESMQSFIYLFKDEVQVTK